jgi:hypothetical protein
MIEIKLDADEVVARKPAKERPALTITLGLVAQIAWHFACAGLFFMVGVGALIQNWKCR